MKDPLAWLKKLGRYLWGKRAELTEMSEADVLLGKVVLDIHRKRRRSHFVSVPLFSLKQIHPINRDNSVAATEKRIAVLKEHGQAIAQAGHLDRAGLNRYLPSVSAVKVVADGNGNYIAFEGNGRLVALQNVFTPVDNINVEVEEYLFSDSATILRRINRVRALHNLRPEEDMPR